MNSFSLANSLSVSVRIYRALLVAYPKKFREHYETQMVQVFRDSFREEYHRNGMSGVIDLWLHTCADLLVTALIERISEGSQYMFSPKVILWGGLASVLGGLFWVLSGTSYSPVALVLALVLGLGGLVGLYSQQAGQGGRLGLAGLAFGIIGIGAQLFGLWGSFTFGGFSDMKTDPASAAPGALIYILANIILGIGLVLLGIASLRAKNIHIWRGLPLGLGLLTIIQSMTIWLIGYVPLSQGLLPWASPNTDRFNALFTAADSLVGLGWMCLGILLAIEADGKLTPSPPASA
jgi:hypothetical protein